MTEPAPKPTDALEELKGLLEDMTGYRPFQDSPGREKVNRAIAQWEKERAEGCGVYIQQALDAASDNTRMRAALERIENEMRKDWSPINWRHRLTGGMRVSHEWADALRAIRTGEET